MYGFDSILSLIKFNSPVLYSLSDINNLKQKQTFPGDTFLTNPFPNTVLKAFTDAAAKEIVSLIESLFNLIPYNNSTVVLV